MGCTGVVLLPSRNHTRRHSSKSGSQARQGGGAFLAGAGFTGGLREVGKEPGPGDEVKMFEIVGEEGREGSSGCLWQKGGGRGRWEVEWA